MAKVTLLNTDCKVRHFAAGRSAVLKRVVGAVIKPSIRGKFYLTGIENKGVAMLTCFSTLLIGNEFFVIKINGLLAVLNKV